MSELILAFVIGTILMTPFVFAAYFMGLREGWTKGELAGLNESVNILKEAKEVLIKFKSDVDAAFNLS